MCECFRELLQSLRGTGPIADDLTDNSSFLFLFAEGKN